MSRTRRDVALYLGSAVTVTVLAVWMSYPDAVPRNHLILVLVWWVIMACRILLLFRK
ncbi:MAG: hypothetical protein K0R39_5183 [Symbiobacteriaceae bacterium]|jgi:hypothetical protein|nr:hypothetical protein [Symbiobacteriaceae bacterium]